LVNDREIIWEIPLSISEWVKEDLETEINGIERELDSFSNIFEALKNQNRMKMLCSLIEEKNHTLNFTDFIEKFNMNPKLVRENVLKLHYVGLIDKPARGEYRLTKKGRFCFMMINLTLKKILDSIDDQTN
jgi:predicted transcriptional regulator